jgi:hypothetical protein
VTLSWHRRAGGSEISACLGLAQEVNGDAAP